MSKNASRPTKSGEPRQPRVNPRKDQILEKAAHLFCAKGYDSTSMSDIADAVGITKAGLYYFVESKEHLLYLITDYALDLLDETVVNPMKNVEGSVNLLRKLIVLHIHMMINWPREITMILHERTALTGLYREKILGRKKDYVNHVRELLIRLQKEGLARDVDATAATFFLLGSMNWIYQWYKVDGRLSEEDLVSELTDQFTRSFLKNPEKYTEQD